MEKKTFALIGPRAATKEQCQLLTAISCFADSLGIARRSGGAVGCDHCAEIGWVETKEMEVLRPEHATPDAIDIAAKHHGNWHAGQKYAGLHGRNVQIILGRDLHSPVDFVLTCTDNEERGGTAVGLSVAKKFNIPIFNTFVVQHVQTIMRAIYAISKDTYHTNEWVDKYIGCYQ